MPSLCQVHIKYSHIGSTGRPLQKKETSKTAFIRYNRGFILLSGESGIRTPDRLTSITVFKTAAFNHSANSPVNVFLKSFAQPDLAIISRQLYFPQAGFRCTQQPLCQLSGYYFILQKIGYKIKKKNSNSPFCLLLLEIYIFIRD